MKGRHARKDPRNVSELAVHKFAVALLTFARVDGVVFFHPPNGEARSKATGAKLKTMAVLPGVADLVLVLHGGQAAFLELKKPGGYLRPSQITFKENVTALGARYGVASTPEEVIEILASWGAVKISEARKLLKTNVIQLPLAA